MFGIALGLLITFLSIGVGISTVRRFTLLPLERIAYGGALGLAFLSYGVALLAWLYWLDGLWGLLAVWLVLGAWGWWRGGLSLKNPENDGSFLNRFSWGIVSLLFLLGLGLCLLPPDGNEWDAIAYHLAYPKIYLQSGGMVELPFMHQSYFPPLLDMLFLLGLWLDGESCAKVFHWAMGVLTALGCAGFAQRGGNSGGAPALLVVGTPVIAWQMGTAYVDLSTGLYVGLSAFALYSGVRERATAWLWLGAVLLGFALATKYTALLSWGLLGLIGLLWSVRERWLSGARAWLIAGCGALLIGAPWYVRNGLWTGNPVYPFAYEIFGGKGWSQAQADAYRHDQLKFGMGREPYQLLLAPWNLTATPAPFADPIGVPIGDRAYLLPMMGMGYLATVGLMIIGGLSAGLSWLALFVLGSFVSWFYLMQQIRYLIPLFPVVAGMGGFSLTTVPPWLRRAYVGVLGLQAGFTLWLLGSAYLPSVPLAMQDREAYLQRRLQIYPAVRFLNQQASESAGVLLLDETRGYYLNRPYTWANAGHHRLIPYDTMQPPSQLMDWMRAHNYRYVLYNQQFRPAGEPEHWRRLFEQAIAEGLLLLRFEARGVEVYELAQEDD